MPDNDEAGKHYADDVAQLVLAAGAEDVRLLNLADFAPLLPVGGDLADVFDSPDWCGLPISEGAEPQDVGRWILATANPWPLQPAKGQSTSPKPLQWKPYPAEALPEPFRGFVELATRACGFDASYLALPLLVAAGAAIGTTRRL